VVLMVLRIAYHEHPWHFNDVFAPSRATRKMHFNLDTRVASGGLNHHIRHRRLRDVDGQKPQYL